VQEDRRALWYLKKIPLLSEMPSEDISALAQSTTLEEVRRRRVIYLPGDPGRSIYFVSGGRIKISRVTRDGKELTLAYRGPTEIFGELCLMDGGPRQEMAEAIENALIANIPLEEFEKILRSSASVASTLVRILCERRRELENKVEDLVYRDVNAKLAELLLKLAEDYGVDDARGTILAVKVTHQEMANIIGSTRETVSLTLSQFKRQKLITTDGRKIILVDHVGLKSLI
jgi:CRP/FNR family transcriptional regulator, cyclic AMP receptor protein